MGKDVDAVAISREDRTRYKNKVRQCLDVLARMLGESQFEFDRPHIGLEIELNIVDEHGDPLMRNAEVLAAIADPLWETELGRFNVEINVPPRELGSAGELESEVRDDLDRADRAARTVGGRLVLIGILPTLREQDIHLGTLSRNDRYQVLNEQVFAARGESIRIVIDGADERLDVTADSITPEAACTSAQFHLQVSPEEFPATWNAAQACA
ncbi:MAG: glutamate-cysteine ligase family protein, partial [Streptosporangiaceae bacterium]